VKDEYWEDGLGFGNFISTDGPKYFGLTCQQADQKLVAIKVS